jgi:NAD(P)-dependent dehydrogenase (short-subunit alcohol dehydrogenase family)
MSAGADGVLAGKVAVVTGAASGLGRAITARYVEAGARVVAADINAAGLDEVVAELGDAVVAAPTDVTDEASVEALFATALSRFGQVDVAVANAGTGTASLLIDHPIEEWQRIVDLCLTGVFLTLKHAGRPMAAAGSGSIILMSSLNGRQPGRGMGAYCASKAGVSMLAQVGGLELGPSGVRVNAIAPGFIVTNLTSPLQDVPGVIDEYVENTPVGRAGVPSDIAEAALYLASEGSSYVNGTVLEVDGGAHTMRYPDVIAGVGRLLEG